MTNTYNELNNYTSHLTEEIENLKKAIEYTEKFLYDEAPEFYGRHIAEMKNEIAEMTEELRVYTEYEERLAAY